VPAQQIASDIAPRNPTASTARSGSGSGAGLLA
jgi:hypothetical protein